MMVVDYKYDYLGWEPLMFNYTHEYLNALSLGHLRNIAEGMGLKELNGGGDELIGSVLGNNQVSFPIQKEVRLGTMPLVYKLKKKKDFLIVGQPHSGTKYMSELFTAFGFPIGHEHMGEYGVSSWMLAIDSYNVRTFPSLDAVQYTDYRFRNRIYVVRDTVKVFCACYYIGNKGWSEGVMEPYIVLGGNGYDRTMFTLLGWDKLIRRQNIGLIVRVEEAPMVILDFLKSKGYVDEDVSLDSFDLPPTNVHHREHPVFGYDHIIDNLSIPFLKDEFDRLIKIHGYSAFEE